MSFEKTPLKVRFPMRICFSMSAVIKEAQRIMRTTPISPAKKTPIERKLKIETA